MTDELLIKIVCTAVIFQNLLIVYMYFQLSKVKSHIAIISKCILEHDIDIQNIRDIIQSDIDGK